MLTQQQAYRLHSEGQIALERALFCVECELIFAGSLVCPRCGDTSIWPLMDWLPSARTTPAWRPRHEN